MNKHAKIPLNGSRMLLVICAALLSISGFLAQCLMTRSFWEPLVLTVTPVLPGVLLYLMEYRSRLLERTFFALKNLKLLAVALPLLLGCLGIYMHESGGSLGVYWVLSFILCACFIQQSLYYDPDLSCAAMLLNLLVFCGLSWYLDLYAGSTLAMGFLVFPLSIRMMKTHFQKEDRPGAMHRFVLFFLVCLALIAVFLDSTLDKLLFVPFSPADEEAFLCMYQLINMIPCASVYLGALLGLLLVAAGDLAHSNRNMSPLALGCFYLLVFRFVSALLAIFHLNLGLTNTLPFFGGSAAQRTLDFLLAAVVMMPLKPAKLSALDPEDPDFDAQEEAALALLPRNMAGLSTLCQYLYGNPSNRGWQVLFEEFQELMDTNSLRIMVLHANSLFSDDYFRDKYPVFFRMAGSTEILPLPTDFETMFPNNSFIDNESAYETHGTSLTHYWGQKTALLIPPCWHSIGLDAMASNLRLKAVSIPQTIRRICFGAFYGCSNLTHLELHNGLEEIGPFAFSETALQAVSLPETLTCIEHCAFSETHLEQVCIPGGVRKISEFAFDKNEHLRSVTIQEGVEEIGAGAFRDCPQLCELHIPDSVHWIHPSAFEGCFQLRQVEASDCWKEQYPDLHLSCMDQELRAEYEKED